MGTITVKNLSKLRDAAALFRVGYFISGKEREAVMTLGGKQDIVIEQDGNIYTVKHAMPNVTRIRAEVGKIYTNRCGDAFMCICADDDDAIMKRMSDGYTLTAHGIQQYDDDTIEWDYSTGGRFE